MAINHVFTTPQTLPGHDQPWPSVCGSGTAVAYDAASHAALIVSCWHITPHPGAFYVTFADGTQSTAELLATDQTADVSFLSAPIDHKPAVVSIGDPPRQGDAVYKVGFAGGHLGSGQGVIGEASTDDALVAQIVVRPGDSGGGFFNRDGMLVGVISYYVVENDNYGGGPGVAAISRLRERVCWPRRKRQQPAPKTQPPPKTDPQPPAPSQPQTDQSFKQVLDQLDKLQGSIRQSQQAIEDRLSKLEQRQAQPGAKGDVGPRGPQGPAGPAGPKGDPGQPADDARLTAIEQKIQDLTDRVNKLPTAPAPERVRVVPAQP